MARLRETISFIGTGADTCGFVVWSADYPSNGTPGSDTEANIIMFKSPASSTNPVNTALLPFGAGTQAAFEGGAAVTNGSCAPDPAANLMTTSLVEGARTIGASIRLSYTGRQDSASGQITFIKDLDASKLMSGGTGGAPMSVDDLFQHAGSGDDIRFGLHTYEVVNRIQKNSDVFRHEGSGPLAVGSGVGIATALTADLEDQSPRFFGFAWRQLDTTANNPFVFSFTKNLEWRAGNIMNLTHQPRRTIHNGDATHEALRILDTHTPGWEGRIVGGETHSRVKALAPASTPFHPAGLPPGWTVGGGRTNVTGHIPALMSLGGNYISKNAMARKALGNALSRIEKGAASETNRFFGGFV